MLYVLMIVTLLSTVAAQLLLKKGLMSMEEVPGTFADIIPFFIKAFSNIYVLTAIFAVVVAALCWILALSRADLGHIYPFMGLSFVLVALFSSFLLKESISLSGWTGIVLVCAGVFLVLRS